MSIRFNYTILNISSRDMFKRVENKFNKIYSFLSYI